MLFQIYYYLEISFLQRKYFEILSIMAYQNNYFFKIPGFKIFSLIYTSSIFAINLCENFWQHLEVQVAKKYSCTNLSYQSNKNKCLFGW